MQRESVKVVNPFCTFVRERGWHVVNFHGNQFQAGVPDKRIMHSNYGGRWVEFKVIEDNGQVGLTDAQLKEWPKWIAHGEKIWVVCAKDLRGALGIPLIQKWYNKIVYGEPNAHLMLHHSTRKMGIHP
jgi:hypothetical protein